MSFFNNFGKNKKDGILDSINKDFGEDGKPIIANKNKTTKDSKSNVVVSTNLSEEKDKFVAVVSESKAEEIAESIGAVTADKISNHSESTQAASNIIKSFVNEKSDVTINVEKNNDGSSTIKSVEIDKANEACNSFNIIKNADQCISIDNGNIALYEPKTEVKLSKEDLANIASVGIQETIKIKINDGDKLNIADEARKLEDLSNAGKNVSTASQKVSFIQPKQEEDKKIILMNLEPPALDTEEDVLKEIDSLKTIKTSWKDYCLMMLNSTAEPLRSIWREKIITSITHWEFGNGSISEGNIAGLEIMSALPSELTKSVVNDYYEPGAWQKLNRLSGSKRMNIAIGKYPEESLSNEANTCIKYIVKHWDKYGHLIHEIQLLERMWELAQQSAGKCVSQDEVLTYLLEKPLDDKIGSVWIEASTDIFENGIPSTKYEKYYKAAKIEGFPLEPSHDIEVQKKNFTDMCDIILKEDVGYCCCWKKICICILKNDVSMKYAGFGATLRERKAREDAVAAFSTKQEEKEKAKIAAAQLATKIEKERKQNA